MDKDIESKVKVHASLSVCMSEPLIALARKHVYQVMMTGIVDAVSLITSASPKCAKGVVLICIVITST